LINYEDAYVQPLIQQAIRSHLHSSLYTSISSVVELPSPSSPLLQISAYESIDFEHLLAHPSTALANAYIIRKALIRKHYLSHTVSSWLTKNPQSLLKQHVQPSVDFELDYAEFLDEAILEAYELHESFSRNKKEEPVNRDWWILKPSMSDRGQGIRLFSTEGELRTIFEDWEAERPDSESDSIYGPDEETAPPFDPTAPILDGTKLAQHAAAIDNGIITSQLRHFVAQPYIHPPLLLSQYENRKFHIRTYVVAVGALRVYVYREMLALFAPVPYIAPGSSSNYESDCDNDGSLDLHAHLTNTCLQDGSREGSVHPFWSLPSTLPRLQSEDWKLSVFEQICAVTGELFEAAARGQMIHFQTLPNAFEVFGVDWMVDAEMKVWLLEVNAFPDFKQTGDDLSGLIARLWEGVIMVGVKEFFALNEDHASDEEKSGMRKVLDVNLGRR